MFLMPGFSSSVPRHWYCDEHWEQSQRGRNCQERWRNLHQDRADPWRIAENVREAFRWEGYSDEQGMCAWRLTSNSLSPSEPDLCSIFRSAVLPSTPANSTSGRTSSNPIGLLWLSSRRSLKLCDLPNFKLLVINTALQLRLSFRATAKLSPVMPI